MGSGCVELRSVLIACWWWSRDPPTAGYQRGCARIQAPAYASAAVTAGQTIEDRIGVGRSRSSACSRSADGSNSVDRYFQPNNDFRSSPALDHATPFVVPRVASRLNCSPRLGRRVGSLAKDDSSDHWRLTRMYGCTWIMSSGGGIRTYRCSTTTRNTERREAGYRLCGVRPNRSARRRAQLRAGRRGDRRGRA